MGGTLEFESSNIGIERFIILRNEKPLGESRVYIYKFPRTGMLKRLSKSLLPL